MWAVYLCGATDCFLHALFMTREQAYQWAEQESNNPEGFHVKRWDKISDIDTSDTGWEQL
jgi:hypothetical protein